MADLMSDAQSTDSATLALLGKKQVLKRRFGLISLFGFAVCELITWETVLALFSQALANGGPAGAVYGYIIAWLSTLSVYTVISELASMAPIAGGQYYWVYMLAPARYRRVASYIVGWLTSLAWVATVATETLFAGIMIQGIAILDNPDYAAERYQGTLITWGVILGCIFVNVVIPAWLPRFEIFILVFHIAGFFAIMITLLTVTPQLGSAQSVWMTVLNTGNWPTQGVSYCVGFLGNVATFVGADASVHLAEEVSNAAINIPRAILGAMLINGVIGFAMMVTVLYCLGDATTVLDTATGYPFIQIFANSVGNIAGATFMSVLVMLLTWACSIGITTTASRMTWSFARDRGLPGSKWLSRVSPRTKIPVIAVLVVTAIAALLVLINIGSPTVFNDVISLTITGFYGSYFLPCALLLYHRMKGNILPKGTPIEPVSTFPGAETSTLEKSSVPYPTETHLAPDEKAPIPTEPVINDVSPPTSTITAPPVSSDTEAVANARLVWGPWHIPGLLGVLNNAYACVYMIFVIFWSVWPPDNNPNAMTMNYSVVVTGGVMILSAVWYFIGGKRQYKGPLIDEDVAAVMRLGSIVQV